MKKNRRYFKEVKIRHNTVIGALIRQYRKEKKVSQLKLATFLGYSSAQIVSKWEKGESSPSATTLLKLIAFLRIPPHSLMSTVMKCQSDFLALEQREKQRVFLVTKQK